MCKIIKKKTATDIFSKINVRDKRLTKWQRYKGDKKYDKGIYYTSDEFH